MALQFSYPGVYIEEFTPAAPIQGVGTSTAAFVGIAAEGSIGEPVRITTSFERFQEAFGALPVPGFYLWYAVRGFFANGGQVCYVVRASNGQAMCDQSVLAVASKRRERVRMHDSTAPLDIVRRYSNRVVAHRSGDATSIAG